MTLSLEPLQVHTEFGQTVLLADNGETQFGELELVCGSH